MSGQPEHLPTGRGWPRLKAALGVFCRWQGVLEGKWPKPLGGCFSLAVYVDLLDHNVTAAHRRPAGVAQVEAHEQA